MYSSRVGNIFVHQKEIIFLSKVLFFFLGTLGRRFSSQVSRTDSQSSDSPSRKGSTAETNFDLMKTPSFGFSRGPSPLTLGMSDVVPIAVAFQEVCHAMFNGSEESKCQTRLIGEYSSLSF